MRYGTELQQKELKAAIKNGIIGGSVQENVYGHLFKPTSRSNKREAVYNWKPDLKKKPQVNEISKILANNWGKGQ